MHLSPAEKAVARGESGEAAAMALRIVVETGRLFGAPHLIEIVSAHIDGCLYHGDSGVEFAERLTGGGGRVRVPTTLNVGALDLLNPGRVRAEPHRRRMALRLMRAYEALGCRPTWTCAPYQAGHRPALGTHIAWGESNAIAFANSVLGARTERYGDFLDICAAIAGRVPYRGLHRDEDRRARILVDTAGLTPALKDSDVFYPVLGAWLGEAVGAAVAVLTGLPGGIPEDRLKAMGAAASTTGAVGLFHIAGVTPEAPTAEAALGGEPPERTIALTPDMVRQARDRLSTVDTDGGAGTVDAVALGSPHFSLEEFGALERLAGGRRFKVPVYVCTGRAVRAVLEHQGRIAALEEAGVEIVVDTCIVVTPILPERGGVLMTNSGKFAHYGPANTGYEAVYGSLADCVASAEAGRVTRDESVWR